MVGFVVPVEGEAVRCALADALVRLNADGCLLPYPPDYWHITIVPPALLAESARPQTAGGPPLLPLSFAREALETARRTVRGAEPFEVSVRGLNAFRDVLVAVPYDNGHGLALGRLLHSALPELPERYHTGHDPVPHISLAQYARGDRLEPLAGLLEAERETPLGTFRVERLEMFVLPVHDGAPGPVEKHEIPLGRP
jgi:2'-5' RNA ligase